jgi:hypothetical protein
METILIATDFSSAARNATAYGFELARQMHAKVIFFTAYQLPSAMPDSAPKNFRIKSFDINCFSCRWNFCFS